LDLLLLGSLITVIIESHDATCSDEKPCWRVTGPMCYYMGVLMFLSFLIDGRIMFQLNYNYINRRLAILSWMLDIAIFAGGIWEIVIGIQISHY